MKVAEAHFARGGFHGQTTGHAYTYVQAIGPCVVLNSSLKDIHSSPCLTNMLAFLCTNLPLLCSEICSRMEEELGDKVSVSLGWSRCL